MRVRILGFGMGAGQVTAEVAEALRGSDYVVAFRKRDEDGLLDVRREICDTYGVELVIIADAERDRSEGLSTSGYSGAVDDWHEARAEAVEQVLATRGGAAAFLVWGDPALYDSTIRIVERVAARGTVPIDFDVLPGISAPQLLAARHRIVLHPVGRPVHITTARRLREAIADGQTNIVAMLGGRRFDLTGLEDWRIWWGANLGTGSEELICGRVGDVLVELTAARERARQRDGWVMDIYLLRQ